MMNHTEKLSSIRIKLNQVENEIKFLEEYLLTTSGPAESTIAELNMLREVQSFYITQYGNVMKEKMKDEAARSK
jgi:hypothetical protein